MFLMEAKELRIGNWYEHNGEYKQVSPNTIVEVWEAKRLWCKPIPLTTEILEKAGFKKIEGIGWECYNLTNYDISVYLNGFATIRTYDEDADKFPCKYLHQLQNLYYALTGEELDIKL